MTENNAICYSTSYDAFFQLFANLSPPPRLFQNWNEIHAFLMSPPLPPFSYFSANLAPPTRCPAPCQSLKKKIKNPKKIEKFIIKETETDVIPEKKSPTFFAKWFKLSTKSQKKSYKSRTSSIKNSKKKFQNWVVNGSRTPPTLTYEKDYTPKKVKNTQNF